MVIPVTPGQLPSGFCPTTHQEMLNGFSAVQSVNVDASSGTGLVVSATKPVSGTLPWLKLDQFGRPERVYWFASGAWLSMHPLVPGSTIWYFDVLPDFTTFDGGDALAASAISGPMWQQAKNSDGVVIAAKFPIAAGTLPSGTVLAQGATGGSEDVTLTLAQTPPHTHTASFKQDDTSGGNQNVLTSLQSGQTGPTDFTDIIKSAGGNATGGTDSHTNMPVFVVGYLLQRSQRLFYSIT